MTQDTEMEGSFMLSRVQRLNKASAPCTVDPKTSLTSCLKVLHVNCECSWLVIQRFLHCQQYVIRQVGCELDFLGDNLKEEKSLSDEVKDTSSENGVVEEKNAACFTNNRLNALYSIFIW